VKPQALLIVAGLLAIVLMAVFVAVAVVKVLPYIVGMSLISGAAYVLYKKRG
jgi:hypothetical protein